MSKSRQLRWYTLSATTLFVLVAGLVVSAMEEAEGAFALLGLALALFLGSGILLYLDLRQESQQRQVLLRVTQELSSRLELGDLLDYIVHAILQLVPPADKCVIHLLDEEGQRLYPRYSSQPDWEQTLGIPFGKGIAGQALKELRTIVIPDVRKEANFLPLQSGAELRSLLVAPLYVQGKLLGTISLNSSKPKAFNKRDEALVTMLAAQASAALYQTQLYEAAVRETHYVEVILNNLSDGLVVLDAEGRVLRYNPSLAHILGTDVSGLIGGKVDPQSSCEGLRRLAFLLGDLLNKREDAERQVEIEEPIHAVLRVSVSSVQDGEGEWEQVVVIHDQTEEQDLVRAVEGMMVAASHELHPALEAIRGYAMLLQSCESPDCPEMKGWALQVFERSARLMRLADDLVDLCAIHNGEFKVHPEPVSVAEIIEEVVAELEPACQRREVTLAVQYPSNLPDLALDPERLRHVLLNILENALRRAFTGGTIHLQIEATFEELICTISDDGRPLPSQVRQSVFRGLYRFPKGMTDTGLDLYVSRKIIEAHGGTLWLVEERPRGATLQFILPLIPRADV
ncbi:MAG: GAF domain-containing protein [Anaerolineae bacterium]|nr:GAF domain-containing protein [Anaerolineae bacterium]